MNNEDKTDVYRCIDESTLQSIAGGVLGREMTDLEINRFGRALWLDTDIAPDFLAVIYTAIEAAADNNGDRWYETDKHYLAKDVLS